MGEEDVIGGMPSSTRTLISFHASVDGLLGVEATATMKSISSCLAKKWRQTYSRACGYVKSRVAITLVRATHRCIRGSRVPAQNISFQRSQWEDGLQVSAPRDPKTRRSPDSAPTR